MSEDSEDLKNQDNSPLEQPQPETPEPTAPFTNPGDGVLSDFRQALEEQEAVDAAAKAQKERRPGIIRRMASTINRGTGRLDERTLPLTQEPPVADPVRIPNATAEQGTRAGSSQPPPDPGMTGATDDRELDAQMANLWPDQFTQPVEAGQVKSLSPMSELQAGERLSMSAEPVVEPVLMIPTDTDAAEEPTPGEAPDQQPALRPETYDDLLAGDDLFEGPVATSPAAGEGPTIPSEPSKQPAQEAAQPRLAPSLRRLVTGFLMPSGRQKKEEEPETMPDDQIADRLKTASTESAERPPVPLLNPSKKLSPGLGEAPAGESLVGEAQAEEAPSDIVSFPRPKIRPASDEDRALWGAYVDSPPDIQARPAEPSPFIEDNLTHTITPSSNEDAKTELLLTSGSELQPQAPEDSGPFISTDSPGLGELRGEISVDDDLPSPLPVPEVEVPAEKSDIWERLFAEQERGEQVGQSTWTKPLDEANDALYPQDAPTLEESETETPVSEEDIHSWSAQPQGPSRAAEAPGPSWSEDGREKNTDGYGNWYEEGGEDGSGLLGLPEPSREASEELRESTKLYDSIFEDQKREEMRSVLLGEEAGQAEVQTADPMSRFTEESEEKPKPWWVRLTPVQKAMIILAAILVVVIVILTGLYFYPRAMVPGVAPEPTVAQVDVSSAPNGPYPIGVEFTGGWIFNLNRSTRVQGRWTPQGGEWLDGTQIRRVLTLPWSRQTEAVVRSFQVGDEIRLYFSNKQTILYKVTEVKQVTVDDVSVMSDTHSSLAIILYQTTSTQRWVVIAAQ